MFSYVNTCYGEKHSAHTHTPSLLSLDDENHWEGRADLPRRWYHPTGDSPFFLPRDQVVSFWRCSPERGRRTREKQRRAPLSVESQKRAEGAGPASTQAESQGRRAQRCVCSDSPEWNCCRWGEGGRCMVHFVENEHFASSRLEKMGICTT